MKLNFNKSKILIEYMANKTNMPIVTLTKDLRIDQYNKAFEKLIDNPGNIYNSLFEKNVGRIIISSQSVTDKGLNIKEISCTYNSKSGSVTYLQGSLIKKEEDTVIIFKNYLISESEIVSEISQINIEMSNLTRELTKKNFELKLANEKITKLLNTDFLTRIANHKFFFERLKELISLRKRNNYFNIGIIFTDIDFFKSFNDTYGHDVGDLVLIKFVQMLEDNIRKEDIVARIGGEEFCIIVQCMEKNCLFDISEKLRKKCENLVLEGIDNEITASFGATFYKEWEDVDTLMKRADSNMYKAKSNGRNQTVFK